MQKRKSQRHVKAARARWPPRAKRMWIDFGVTMAAMLPLGYIRWWLPLVVSAYGLWNYYDGQTRMNLPNE